MINYCFLECRVSRSCYATFTGIIIETGFNALIQGALTEQFVGQELKTIQASDAPARLYYWRRDMRGVKS